MYSEVEGEFYNIVVKEFSDLIDRMKEHPFNVELMNGMLDYKRFKFYLQQDFLSSVDCARAYLIVAAKVNDTETMSRLIDIIKGAFDFREQYKKYFEDCDLSDNHKKSRACSACDDLFMSTAYHNSVTETLVLSYSLFNVHQIVICHMTNEITTKGIKNNKYKEWINICNGKGMDAVVEEIGDITSRLYKKASDCEKERIYELCRKGLELEIMFLDEAYYSNIPQ
ncbi:MAG: TenA family protein [Wolbachia sp.]